MNNRRDFIRNIGLGMAMLPLSSVVGNASMVTSEQKPDMPYWYNQLRNNYEILKFDPGMGDKIDWIDLLPILYMMGSRKENPIIELPIEYCIGVTSCSLGKIFVEKVAVVCAANSLDISNKEILIIADRNIFSHGQIDTSSITSEMVVDVLGKNVILNIAYNYRSKGRVVVIDMNANPLQMATSFKCEQDMFMWDYMYKHNNHNKVQLNF